MRRRNCEMPMKIPYSTEEIATWKVSPDDILAVMDLYGVLDHSKLSLKEVQATSLRFIEGDNPIQTDVYYEIDVSEDYIKDARADFEYENNVGNYIYQPDLKISEAA